MILKENIRKKRILITGSNGFVGSSLAAHFIKSGKYEILCTSKNENELPLDIDFIKADLSVKKEVKGVFTKFYPDFVVNAAAMTNVDGCEEEKEYAWQVNVKPVEYLSVYCRAMQAKLIHFSTDYIFDGNFGPYYEEDLPNPLNNYGRTKLASENALQAAHIENAIIRTNVVFGNTIGKKKDFIAWLIEKLSIGHPVSIVDDQYNNPTFVNDLVFTVKKIIECGKSGVFNVGGKDFLSRYEFAQKTAEIFDLDSSLIFPVSTQELKQAAIRPLKSGLITLKAETELGLKPYSVVEALNKMKRELKNEINF